MLQQPNLIALEPTVGFMTLDATDLFLFHGKVFVFRRISDKYSECGLNIENIMPKERLAYCIECLQHLWDRRIHAWSTKEKFDDSFEGFAHGFRAVNHAYNCHPSRHGLQHRVTRHTTPLDFGENRVDQEIAEDVEYYPEDDEEEDDEEEDEENNTYTPGASSQEKRPFSQLLSSDNQADIGGVSIDQYARLGDSATDNTNTAVKLSFQLDGANDEAPATPQKTSVLSENTKTLIGIRELESSNSLSLWVAHALASENLATKRVNTKRVNNATLSFNIYTPPQWAAINTSPPQTSTSTSALRQLSSIQPTSHPTMSGEEPEYRDDHMDLAVDQPLQGTFNIPISEKYQGVRAGVPLGDPVEYQYKKGISFPAPPMQDLGPMFPQESLEEPHMKRPEVYRGGVTRQAIISSAVRASGVKRSNQECDVPSPASNGFKHVPQSIPDLKVSSISSSTLSSASKGNGLQTFLAAAKMGMASLPANMVNTSPNVHIKTATSSTSTSAPLGSTENPMVFPSVTTPVHTTFVKPLNQGALVSKPQTSTTAASPQRRQPNSPKIQAPSEAHLLAQQRSQQAAQFQQDRGRVPAAPILCSCRKPSRPGDKIVTCSNTECPILTYHYRCLDKSQKLSTKGAKWVCAMCKATAMYAAKAAKQPKTDFKFPFNKQEIEDAFAFAGNKAMVNPYGFGVGKYNGYQPEKYGVVGSRSVNGEVRAVYGVDPSTENIGEESENSSSSSFSSDESEDAMEDFIVTDEPTDDPHQVPSSSPEQSSLVRTPSPPMTLLKGGGGMQRVYAIDTPIPLALRTWEVVEEDEDEVVEEDEDEDEIVEEDEEAEEDEVMEEDEVVAEDEEAEEDEDEMED
jgi:hypothetical protein